MNKRNFKLMDYFENNKLDIDEQDSTGQTNLHYAVIMNDYEYLIYLLEKGSNPNITDNRGQTALMLSCYYGNTFSVEDLYDYVGDKQKIFLKLFDITDINIKDKNDWSILEVCCLGRNDYIQLPRIKLIIESKRLKKEMIKEEIIDKIMLEEVENIISLYNRDIFISNIDFKPNIKKRIKI